MFRWRQVLLLTSLMFFMSGIVLYLDANQINRLVALIEFLALLLAFPLAQSTVSSEMKKHSATSSEIGDVLDRISEKTKAYWLSEQISRGFSSKTPLEILWEEKKLLESYDLIWPSPLPNTPLSSSQLIVRFRENRPKRLVILGGAGSGKTTLAVQLAIDLCAVRKQGGLVPLLLSLSSWDAERISLHKWTAQELLRSYPWLAGEPSFNRRDSSAHLIPKFTLILDGLDELSDSLQAHVLKRLDEEVGHESSLILTCRSETYRRLVGQSRCLSLAPVVSALPVSAERAVQYMRGRIDVSRQDTFRPLFNHVLLNPNSPTTTALSSPLVIWLAERIFAAGGQDPSILLNFERFKFAKDIRLYLLRELVRQTFEGSVWPVELSHKWLSTLAQQLTRAGVVNIAWWRLRDFVPPFGILTIFSSIGALFFGLSGHYRYDQGISFAITGAVAAGLASGFRRRPEDRYKDLRGLDIARSSLRLLGRAALLVLVLLIASNAFLGVALGGVVGAAMIAILQYTWIPVSLSASRDSPAVVLRRHFLVFVRNVLGGAVGGTMAGCVLGAAVTNKIGLLPGAFTGLAGGLVIGLLRANAWLGYRIAHFWFAVQGQYPWHLISFLSEAHKRYVLRQSGSVYQFRHLDLQLCLTEERQEWRSSHQLPGRVGRYEPAKLGGNYAQPEYDEK